MSEPADETQEREGSDGSSTGTGQAGPCHSGLGDGSSPAQTPALPRSLAQHRRDEEGIHFGFVFSQKHSSCGIMVGKGSK